MNVIIIIIIIIIIIVIIIIIIVVVIIIIIIIFVVVVIISNNIIIVNNAGGEWDLAEHCGLSGEFHGRHSGGPLGHCAARHPDAQTSRQQAHRPV